MKADVSSKTMTLVRNCVTPHVDTQLQNLKTRSFFLFCYEGPLVNGNVGDGMSNQRSTYFSASPYDWDGNGHVNIMANRGMFINESFDESSSR